MAREAVSMPVVEFTKTITETDVYLFAGVTGDLHRNHIDEEYMRTTRYGKRIAHGALMVGLMSAASAKAESGWKTVSYGYDRVRFIRPVFFGDTITVRYQYTHFDPDAKKLFARVECINQNGEVVAAATHIKKVIE